MSYYDTVLVEMNKTMKELCTNVNSLYTGRDCPPVIKNAFERISVLENNFNEKLTSSDTPDTDSKFDEIAERLNSLETCRKNMTSNAVDAKVNDILKRLSVIEDTCNKIAEMDAKIKVLTEKLETLEISMSGRLLSDILSEEEKIQLSDDSESSIVIEE